MAKRLLDEGLAAGVNITPEVSGILTTLSGITPAKTMATKVVHTVGGAVNKGMSAAKNFGLRNALTPEGIKKDPLGALDALQERVSEQGPSVTADNYTTFAEDYSKTYELIKEAAIHKVSQKEFNEKNDKIVDTIVAVKNNLFNPVPTETVEKVVNATERNAVLGSSIDALLGSMRVGGPNDQLSDTDLDSLTNSNILTEQEKNVVKNYKKIRKSVADVDVDLAVGSPGYKGNVTYLEDIDKAIALNDQDKATEVLAIFNDWVKRYTDNRQNIVDAFDNRSL
jgi:hypothetical protein